MPLRTEGESTEKNKSIFMFIQKYAHIEKTHTSRNTHKHKIKKNQIAYVPLFVLII